MAKVQVPARVRRPLSVLGLSDLGHGGGGRMTKLTVDLDHFRARVLQDALTEARADQWLRRAQQFENAAPRKRDFRGNASDQELLDAYERCGAIAAACRAHAQLLRDKIPGEISDEVWCALGEVT
jgi:hypothetical protein